MPNAHGDWIWYELMTPDADAAARFYAGVLGWTVGDQPEYREITTSTGHVGGMLPSDMLAGGARPAWVGYIKVADVDAAIASVGEGGGRVLMPPRDMPGVGRFALVTDPAGAPFYVMTPAGSATATSTACAVEPPIDGHVAWNELAAPDVAAAFHFYGTRFGWLDDGAMDMGPAGSYAFIRHGVRTGGIAPVMPGQHPGWTFYFRVPAVPAALAAVTAGGGKVIVGPHPIPGGDHIVIGTDPQGAVFALVGPPG